MYSSLSPCCTIPGVKWKGPHLLFEEKWQSIYSQTHANSKHQINFGSPLCICTHNEDWMSVFRSCLLHFMEGLSRFLPSDQAYLSRGNQCAKIASNCEDWGMCVNTCCLCKQKPWTEPNLSHSATLNLNGPPLLWVCVWRTGVMFGRDNPWKCVAQNLQETHIKVSFITVLARYVY